MGRANARTAPERDAVLAELRAEYKADRECTSAEAPSAQSVDWGPCRYCGKHWRRWEGSQLDGHAKCVVSLRFQRRVLEVASGTITHAQIAFALGVTQAVLRAWITNALKVGR